MVKLADFTKHLLDGTNISVYIEEGKNMTLIYDGETYNLYSYVDAHKLLVTGVFPGEDEIKISTIKEVQND